MSGSTPHQLRERQLREVKLDIDVNVKEQCFIRRRDTVSSRDGR
jgi:hypothetical protein